MNTENNVDTEMFSDEQNSGTGTVADSEPLNEDTVADVAGAETIEDETSTVIADEDTSDESSGNFDESSGGFVSETEADYEDDESFDSFFGNSGYDVTEGTAKITDSLVTGNSEAFGYAEYEANVDASEEQKKKKRKIKRAKLFGNEDDIDLFAEYNYKDRAWWTKYKVALAAIGGTFCIALIVCSVIVLRWRFNGVYTDNLGEHIRSEVTTVIATTTAPPKEEPKPLEGIKGEVISEVELPEEVVPIEEAYDLLSVDFEELHKKYPNAVGWLKVPGVDVEYPVAQTTDNEYYLTHSIDGTYSRSGWVFMDYRQDNRNIERNLIVYGHNMADGTIFGKLKRTINEEWWGNPDNQYIYFTTPYYEAVYQVFNVMQVRSTEVYYHNRDLDSTTITDYMKEMLQYNLLDGKLAWTPKFKSTNQIITLSTCADAAGSEKYVVQGVLLYQRSTFDGPTDFSDIDIGENPFG